MPAHGSKVLQEPMPAQHGSSRRTSLALKHPKHKLLPPSAGRCVLDNRRAHRRPVLGKGVCERDLIVLLNDGATAFGGAFGGKGGHNELGPLAGSQAQRPEVRLAILSGRQEVEGRAVVPQRVRPSWHEVRDVRHHPRDAGSVLPQPFLGAVDGVGRDVEHRHIGISSPQEVIDHEAVAPAHVENGRVKGKVQLGDEVQRRLWHRLVPAARRQRFGVVDGLPVGGALRRVHAQRSRFPPACSGTWVATMELSNLFLNAEGPKPNTLNPDLVK